MLLLLVAARAATAPRLLLCMRADIVAVVLVVVGLVVRKKRERDVCKGEKPAPRARRFCWRGGRRRPRAFVVPGGLAEREDRKLFTQAYQIEHKEAS